MLPTAVTFNNNINTYTLSGPGAIGGSTSLVKLGSATTILANTNTYTGGTFISGGVLSIAFDAALGTAPSAAAINITLGGGTLQFSAPTTLSATRTLSVNASGGAIDVDSNATTINGVIAGTGPLQINNTGNGSGGVLQP